MTERPVRRFAQGYTVRVRADVQRSDDGLLLGGSPIRAMRLAPAARILLADGRLRVSDARTDALTGRLLDGNLADPVLGPATPRPAELTVVLPVRDRPQQLARTLSGLIGLACIVVDDASRDPGAVAAVAARFHVELVSLPVNQGPAAARNAGLRRVRTPYVAFVDSDVAVDATTLLRLARHFADDRLALVGPLLRGRPATERANWFERYDMRVSSLTLGDRPCSVRPGAAVAWLPSACLVARTDYLGAGFTESLRVAEDVDLVWRLVDAGYAVRYDPAEMAEHDTRRTLREWLGRKFVYGTGGAELAARHGRTGAPAVLSGPAAATAAALLIRHRWAAPLVAVGLALDIRSLIRRLPDTPDRPQLAIRLAVRSLGWAVRQEAALLLRHWWPATLLAAMPSPAVRRAVGSALVIDVLVARIEHPTMRYAPVSRRLDDLAYGAGLWAGAIRHRDVTCLLPRRPGARK